MQNLGAVVTAILRVALVLVSSLLVMPVWAMGSIQTGTMTVWSCNYADKQASSSARPDAPPGDNGSGAGCVNAIIDQLPKFVIFGEFRSDISYIFVECRNNSSGDGGGTCDYIQDRNCYHAASGTPCAGTRGQISISFVAVFAPYCPHDSVLRSDQAKCECRQNFMPSSNQQSCVRYPMVSHFNGVAAGKPQTCFGDPIVPVLGIHRQDVEIPVALPRGLSLRLHYDSLNVLPFQRELESGADATGNGSVDPRDAKSSVVGPHWDITSHRRYVEQDFITTVPRIRWGDGVEINVSEFEYSISGANDPDGTFIPAEILVAVRKTGEKSLFQRKPYGDIRFVWVEKKRYLPDGNRLDFTVNETTGMIASIADGYQRAVTFEYKLVGGEQRLWKVIDASNEVTELQYTENGFLKTIIWPDASFRTFLYEKPAIPGALTGVIDENGKRKSTFAYSDSGVATSTEEAGGVNKFSVSYGTPPSIRWIIGSTSTLTTIPPTGIQLVRPNGTTATLGAQMVEGAPLLASQSQPAGSGCLASTSQKMYDAVGNVAWEEDFNGHRACKAHDAARALETVRVEGLATNTACSPLLTAGATLPANARRTSTQWHPTRQLQSRVAQPRLRITNVYNGEPDPLSGGVASCVPSDASQPGGSPLSVLCKRVEEATTDINGAAGFGATVDASVPVRSWKWTYDRDGQLQTSTDPLENTTTYAYYSETTGDHTKGDLQSVTNAKQQAIKFTKYNAAGQWLEMVDANGITTLRSFDAREQLRTVSTGGSTVAYDYWPTGLLKSVTHPDASSITYDYDDAHRLKSIADHLGNSITYTLIWLLPVKRQDPVLCGADIELNLLPDGERDGA